MSGSWRWLLVVIVALASTSARAARDPKAAAEAVRKAELAMAGQRYAEAADRMEEAYSHDPNPLWLANAGYARMMSGELPRALAHFDAALADAKLVGEGRTRASERRTRAATAKVEVDAAVAAEASGDAKGAAQAIDRAFESVSIGLYLLEAAGLWEKAGDLALASERFKAAAARQDLEADQRVAATDGLARVTAALARAAEPEPEPKLEVVHTPREEPNILGWVVVGSGLAVAAFGVTSFFLSADKRATWEDAERDPDGVVVGLERAEAQALEDDARLWWNMGIVGTAVGVAAVATGVVMLATDTGRPETRESVEVGGALVPGGGLVTASGRF